MPRTSRSVAQRLAAQQSKSKKRRAPRTVTPPQEGSAAQPDASSPSMAEILDEVVPSEGGSRAASMSALAPAAAPTANRPATTGGAATRRGTAARPAARPAPTRRRYSEYATEYAYIWTDLQRILVVAGVLVVLLIALSFFVQ
jgi:hypothetical protein